MHTFNKGLAPSRNDGLALAQGKFIFFLDSDDKLSSDCLEKLYHLALQNNADVSLGTVWAYAEDQNDPIYQKRCENLNKWLCFQPFSKKVNAQNFGIFYHALNCLACNKLFRAAFLKKNRLWFIEQNCFHEDNGFWLKVLSCFPVVCGLSDITYFYLIKSCSITAFTQKKRSVRLEHVKKSLTDALVYVQQKKQLQIEKFIRAELYRCEEHRFVAWLWSEQEKYLKIFKLPLFSYKVQYSKGFRVFRILGMTCYKARLFSS